MLPCLSRRTVYGVVEGPTWKFVISERKVSPVLRGVLYVSGQLVGSKGKFMRPLWDVQLQDGSMSFLIVESSAGHQSRERSKTASGRAWMKLPPQFFVNCFVAFANSGDVYGCSVLVTNWLYRWNPVNQSSTSLKSNSWFWFLGMLALDAERILFTMPRIVRLPDLLDRLELLLLLLLDLRDGCGGSWLLDVVGLESGDFDFLRRDNELIHPGDNLSIVDVGEVDMTSNDIDSFFAENSQTVQS